MNDALQRAIEADLGTRIVRSVQVQVQGGDCFAAYAEAFPLEPGWEDRVPLHQIAPLVVHAIKIGGGYVGAATDAIAQYS